MSRMPYEFFIAKRYLRARRKTGFINIITYISIFGVTVGVVALIIVLSVMNGFESEVRSRIISLDSHIRLRTYHNEGVDDYTEVVKMIHDVPHIIGMSPYILEKGMIRFGKRSTGVMVRGAEQATVNDVSDLGKNMIYGRLELEAVESESGRKIPGIVLGRYVADQIMADLGDKVVVISPTGVHSMFQAPPVKQFVVTGFFETGFYEFDNTYVYISIESAQDLFRMGQKISGIEIRLDDLYRADSVVKDLDDRLGFPYYALTWFEMKKNLFSWMQLEKWAMFIVLSLIILVAAFNIISTLIMVVMEKTKEIGILKSMGATSQSITKIFLYEGIVVGVIGTIFGSCIGYGLCWAQQKYRFFSLPGDVYFIDTLPVKMQVLDFTLIGIAAVVICLLASVYPANKAAKLIPVEAIRYE